MTQAPKLSCPDTLNPPTTPVYISIATYKNSGLHFVVVYDLVAQCPKLDAKFRYPNPLLLHFEFEYYNKLNLNIVMSISI